MFLIKILIALGLVLLGAAAVAVALVLSLSMPLADAVNAVLRRVGLAGAYDGSRSIGGHGVGVVDEPFYLASDGAHAEGRVRAKGELWNARCAPELARELEPGTEVSFVYGDNLSVTVVGKIRRPRGGS